MAKLKKKERKITWSKLRLGGNKQLQSRAQRLFINCLFDYLYACSCMVLLCGLSVVRGSIRNVSHDSARQTSSVEVAAARVYWQRSAVFEQQAAASGSSRPAPSWRGHIHTLLQCHVKPGDGEFLFTGSEHFGEAWLGCAPRYKDFLSIYQTAWAARRNSCDFPLDWGSVLFSASLQHRHPHPCTGTVGSL